MDVELHEIRGFLAEHEPFSGLPPTILDELPARLQLRYYRRGTVLLQIGRSNDRLHILRSGAADILDASGSLVERTEPGGSFGASSLLSRTGSRYTITAVEDSLVLVMDGPLFGHLVENYDVVRRFYDALGQERLQHAVVRQQSADESSAAWLRTRLEDLGRGEPVTATGTLSIRDAARIMTERRISALLVVDEERLVGIVTDRDLRSKVVAAGTDPQQPVSSIMTPDPIHLSPDAQAFEALVEMTSRGVHHLPVVAGDRAVGLVSAGDIVRLQQADPVFLVGDIARQPDVAGLARVSTGTPALATQLLRQDASSDDVTRLLTTIADASARRLVGLAEQRFGPAPLPWAWVTLGSQARREISLGSDQDHAIVISDRGELDRAAEQWFSDVATFVSQGLAECGYPLCDGDVMASNPAWRLTQAQWRRQFAIWINEPNPQAVLNCQIFFDARTVVGDPALLASVRADVVGHTPQAKRFLGQLAAQAVQRQTPVGFFRGLALGRRGEEQETVDVKASGVHAIIEVARVHALAHGLEAVSTLDRLHQCAELVNSSSLGDLADAFEFLGHVRMAHQSRQIQAGTTPDNLVRPSDLSSFDKRHLKDAFAMIRSAQEGLAYSYQTHLMS